MKLSTWAKANDMTYQSAWNLFKKGNLPVMAVQLKNGTILVEEDKFSGKSPDELIVYFLQMSTIIFGNLFNGETAAIKLGKIKTILENE